METEVRIMRASFTGEMGYEIYINPKFSLALWEKIFDYGRKFDLVPYGTETMHLLRAEKGYVVIGQETDGTVTPIDINFTWMIGKKKKDFIGKRSLTRSDTAREDRKQLVGIVPLDKSKFIEEGQHIVECEKFTSGTIKILQFLTLVILPQVIIALILNHCISMALIKGGSKLMGAKFFVSTSKGTKNIPVEVVNPVFIDPENKRLSIMKTITSLEGVDVIQKNYQQVIIRGDGKEEFNQSINKEISILPPSKNLEVVTDTKPSIR